jgi:hypothetical protein
MKALLLTAIVSLSSVLFLGFTTKDDLLKLVAEAEKQWNETKPDKAFLSAGNSIEYGLGYLKQGKYTESLWYFDEVIKKDEKNAWAQLFAAAANTGLGDFDKASAHLAKTEGSNADMIGKLSALLQTAKTEKATAETKATTNKKKETTTPKTKPATDTKNDKKKADTTKAGTTGKGGALVYGDYVFTLDYWDVAQKKMVHQQKGFFTLKSDGTYTYMGVSGKYTYNSTTGAITWTSGTFQNMGKNTTTFQRNKTTCQVDFTYHTSSGKVYYSGGRNL